MGHFLPGRLIFFRVGKKFLTSARSLSVAILKKFVVTISRSVVILNPIEGCAAGPKDQMERTKH
jgi:hypothetical protein